MDAIGLVLHPRAFVYGTLRSGAEAHFKMTGATFLGTVKTAPRYSIWDSHDMVVMTRPGTNIVLGELYEVTPAKLAELDDWEEKVFHREPVELEDHSWAWAWIYHST